MDLSNYLQQIIKGGFIVVVGVFIGRGSEYLYRIVIARALGAENFGIFNLAYAIVGLGVSFSIFGLGHATARYIPFFQAKGELGKLKNTILFSYKTTLFLSCFIALLIYLFADLIALKFFHNATLGSFLKIFAWVIPLMCLLQLNSGILRGFKAVKTKVFTEDILKSLFELITLALFLFLIGKNMNAVLFSYFLALGISISFGLYYINSYFPIFRNSLREESVKGIILAFSLPLVLSVLLSQFQNQIATLFLGHYANPLDVGLYNAALLSSQMLGIGLIGINFILMPIFSDLYATGKLDEINQIFVIITRWLFYLTFPVFLIFLFFPEQVLGLFFGQEYLPAGGALKILAFGAVFNLAAGPLGLVTLSLAKTRTYLLYDIIGFGSNLLLCILLVPRYGYLGAAIAQCVGMVLWNCTALWFVHGLLKINPFSNRHLQFSAILSIAILIIFLIINALKEYHRLTIWGLIFYTFVALFVLKRFMQSDREAKELISSLYDKIKMKV